jgi:hypothetical protein
MGQDAQMSLPRIASGGMGYGHDDVRDLFDVGFRRFRPHGAGPVVVVQETRNERVED